MLHLADPPHSLARIMTRLWETLSYCNATSKQKLSELSKAGTAEIEGGMKMCSINTLKPYE